MSSTIAQKRTHIHIPWMTVVIVLVAALAAAVVLVLINQPSDVTVGTTPVVLTAPGADTMPQLESHGEILTLTGKSPAAAYTKLMWSRHNFAARRAGSGRGRFGGRPRQDRQLPDGDVARLGHLPATGRRPAAAAAGNRGERARRMRARAAGVTDPSGPLHGTVALSGRARPRPPCQEVSHDPADRRRARRGCWRSRPWVRWTRTTTRRCSGRRSRRRWRAAAGCGSCSRSAPSSTASRQAAAWDDMALGFAHFQDWQRCALVTDVDWVRHAAKALRVADGRAPQGVRPRRAQGGAGVGGLGRLIGDPCGGRGRRR